MTVSVISNVINIGGNAALIWGFNMGVAGAAIATLASRVFCAVVVLWQLRMDRTAYCSQKLQTDPSGWKND